MTAPADIEPDRYAVRHASERGFNQAFVHEGRRPGAVPLLLVHGWPETKRIWWKVIAPLADAGFEVIAPDLRGFGDSEVGSPGDPFGDVATHARDLYALVRGVLGHGRVVLAGGDLGGPVVQDFALRFPEAAERMVLFNTIVPFDKERMAGLETRAAVEASDYFVRQALDADGLAAELITPEQRRRYIATFYTSRFWAHPRAFTEPLPGGSGPPSVGGRFGGSAAVDFHTEPFGDGDKLRASFRTYESAASANHRFEPPLLGRNPDVEVLLLYGPSDHVIYPDFDRMAAHVFPNHVGPFLLRDCGHFVPWEAPGPFVSGVRSFCRDLLA